MAGRALVGCCPPCHRKNLLLSAWRLGSARSSGSFRGAGSRRGTGRFGGSGRAGRRGPRCGIGVYRGKIGSASRTLFGEGHAGDNGNDLPARGALFRSRYFCWSETHNASPVFRLLHLGGTCPVLPNARCIERMAHLPFVLLRRPRPMRNRSSSGSIESGNRIEHRELSKKPARILEHFPFRKSSKNRRLVL